MEQGTLIAKLVEALEAWRLEVSDQTQQFRSALGQVQEQLERIAAGLAADDEREHQIRTVLDDSTLEPESAMEKLRAISTSGATPAASRLTMLERCVERWTSSTGGALRVYAEEIATAAAQLDKLEDLIGTLDAPPAPENTEELEQARSTAEQAVTHADELERRLESLREDNARLSSELDTVRSQLDAAEARPPEPAENRSKEIESLQSALDDERDRFDRLELRLGEEERARHEAQDAVTQLQRELAAARGRAESAMLPPDDPDLSLIAAALDQPTAPEAPAADTAAMEELRLDLETAQTWIDDAQRKNDALEAECARLREREDQLKRELDALLPQIAALRAGGPRSL
ncbi:MAG: hypothetical protein GC168_11340 [Candidatus Hydrogenedens sp.]|nr:hypothetical protein [Candidatus Hydrogenedens sp.]